MTAMHTDVLVTDSITKLGAEAAGRAAVAASHGGLYAAYLAAKLKLSGVILNDAGVGLDEAGIACLRYLDALSMAAAVIGHDSARIGRLPPKDARHGVPPPASDRDGVRTLPCRRRTTWFRGDQIRAAVRRR